RNFPLIQELGLEPALEKLPHLRKYGAEFGMGNEPDTTRFPFDTGLLPGSRTFNIERALFDNMLMTEARAAGAEIREETGVKQILRLADRDVAVQLDDGQTLNARYLLDSSGQSTIVGWHLNIRRKLYDPNLQKCAYFEHFEKVQRRPGIEEGFPCIIMAEEGWFWVIGLNEKTTSVGFVCHRDFAKTIPTDSGQLGIPANGVLQWAVSRCPAMRRRLRDATGPATNQVLADFSYTCKPYAGDGYFLLGDAACFLDPVFSTGVTLAMMSATEAARQVAALLRGQTKPGRAAKEYIRYLTGSTGIFWSLIRNFYTHSFRELFLNGQGPQNVHGAVISALAGQVFPKPVWALRWRLVLFNFYRRINTRVALVPRRKPFSLLKEPPQELPQFTPALATA